MITSAPRDRERLYELMPAVYRERDAELGYPLRALLRIVADQAALVDRDIQQLWDDLFIETSRPWVDPVHRRPRLQRSAVRCEPDRLAGHRRGALHRPPRPDPPAAGRRPGPRRRREDHLLPPAQGHAADARGAGPRRHRLAGARGRVLRAARLEPDARALPAAERLDRRPLARADGQRSTGRSTTPATPSTSVAIDQSEGWHGIHNIGFFLWRLHAYPLENVPGAASRRRAGVALPLQPARQPGSALRAPAPRGRRIRTRDRAARAGADAAELLREGPREYRDAGPPRADFTDLYGLFEPAPPSTLSPNPLASLVVFRNGTPVSPAFDPNAPTGPLVPAADRLPPARPVAGRPTGRTAHRGRRRDRAARRRRWLGQPDDGIDVWFHYGFASDLGGGPYDRRAWLTRRTWHPPAPATG